MHGDHGEAGALERLKEALETGRSEQAEIGLSKKNSAYFMLHLSQKHMLSVFGSTPCIFIFFSWNIEGFEY